MTPAGLYRGERSNALSHEISALRVLPLFFLAGSFVSSLKMFIEFPLGTRWNVVFSLNEKKNFPKLLEISLAQEFYVLLLSAVRQT